MKKELAKEMKALEKRLAGKAPLTRRDVEFLNRVGLEALRKEGLDRADQLTLKKGADYGHWSGYPAVALAALCFVKAKRMLELSVKIAADPDAREANEPLEDSALDIINYGSFLYALTVKRKGK